MQGTDSQAATSGGKTGEREERHSVPRMLSAQPCLGPRAQPGVGERGVGERATGERDGGEGERENEKGKEGALVGRVLGVPP